MSPRRPRRRRGAALLALGTVLLGLAASRTTPTAAGIPTAAPTSERPTIVLILTDDQRYDALAPFPSMQDLAQHGVTFGNAFVSNPLCCPSRASILTGTYSHSTGVYTNAEAKRFDPADTIAVRLQAAGYTTGLFGKYLNLYKGPPAPGWTRWAAFRTDRAAGGAYFDYDLNVDGTITHYGTDPEDYSTDVLSGMATDFVRSTPGPLFLYFSTFAPHGPAVPAPRDANAFAHLPAYRPPNYNEADVSDKPAWVQAQPLIDPHQARTIDRTYKNQYRALLAVDDAVGSIVQALADTGRLSTSLIVLMGDNGSAFGEHRLQGKQAPYEEDIRVPLIVRYDPVTVSPRADQHLIVNVDIAPTFAEAAGASTTGMEGVSLLGLLSNPSAPWRADFLGEHVRGVSAEAPSYCQVRTERYSYVKYSTGEEELYDLQSDPWQLQNAASDPDLGPVIEALRLRDRELCSPPPPGVVP